MLRILILTILTAPVIVPQQSPVPIFAVGPSSRSVVTGAPFSAEGQSQRNNTLADGTHIASPLLVWKLYRDNEGRTRTERPIEHKDSDPEILIDIIDPVAHLRYWVDPQKKVVRRQTWQASPASWVTEKVVSSKAQVLPQESLGNQIIEGLPCDGTRDTTLWPVGSMGNDRPISIVTETWKSSALQVVVLFKNNNPQSGELVQKLVNISRAPPSAELFAPPPDYTMEDLAAPAYPIGKDVSAPHLVSKVEPAYTEEARKSKLSGTVLLSSSSIPMVSRKTSKSFGL